MHSRVHSNQSGFTLLEVMIAMTIMVIAFGSILAVQGASIQTAIKSKIISTATMLAKNKMIETEHQMDGKPFNDIKEEETGEFPPPYEDYRWKRTVKEIEFPNLDLLGGPGGDKGGGDKEGKEEGGGSPQTEMVGKLVSQFFSKALREVTVEVLVKRSGGDLSYSLSTYWVNLNADFQITQ